MFNILKWCFWIVVTIILKFNRDDIGKGKSSSPYYSQWKATCFWLWPLIILAYLCIFLYWIDQTNLEFSSICHFTTKKYWWFDESSYMQWPKHWLRIYLHFMQHQYSNFIHFNVNLMHFQYCINIVLIRIKRTLKMHQINSYGLLEYINHERLKWELKRVSLFNIIHIFSQNC